MTWTEVADLGSPIVLVPVGSYEQHGPHLPLDTDARIANAVATRAADRLGAVLGPTVTVTASGEHRGFPGTLSIGTTTTADTFVEISRSATWARAVVFVNGHGGNAEAVARATAVLSAERPHLFWSPAPTVDDDAHAGLTETSVLLHLDPSAVRLDRLEAGNVETLVALADRLRNTGVIGVSANGILGDPRRASAEHGATIVARWVDDLVRSVTTASSTWPSS